MSYAIICDARKGGVFRVSTLALVDRKKCKSLWWTSHDPDIMLRYESESAAGFACGRLRRNNPRVVDASEAESILREQGNAIMQEEAEQAQGFDDFLNHGDL